MEAGEEVWKTISDRFLFKSYSMYKTSALLEDRRDLDWSYVQREITKSTWQERLQPKCLRQVRCCRADKAKEVDERHNKDIWGCQRNLLQGLVTWERRQQAHRYITACWFTVCVFGLERREREQIFNKLILHYINHSPWRGNSVDLSITLAILTQPESVSYCRSIHTSFHKAATQCQRRTQLVTSFT